MTVLNKYIHTPQGSTVRNRFSHAPEASYKAALTRKEEKELSRLRLVPFEKRTTAQARRLIILTQRAKPFNSMPQQPKTNRS